MPEQKYFSEVILGLCNESVALLQPLNIRKVSNDPHTPGYIKNAHIYAIGKRPRLSIKPNLLHHDNKYVYGTLCRHVDGEMFLQDFRLTKTLFSPEVVNFQVSKYPHNTLLALDVGGRAIHIVPVALIAPYMLRPFDPWTDVEIIYIGQAFGKKGERSALDRLKDHSTLQKIQSEVLANEPDTDILILLFNYDHPLQFSLHDGAGSPRITGDEDDQHYLRILRTGIRYSDITTLAEAGLIRYFQPHYNAVYKNSFPTSDMKSLQQCYDLDLLSLSVELDTEDIHIKTYSRKTRSTEHHMTIYDLHSDVDRCAFFCTEDTKE